MTNTYLFELESEIETKIRSINRDVDKIYELLAIIDINHLFAFRECDSMRQYIIKMELIEKLDVCYQTITKKIQVWRHKLQGKISKKASESKTIKEVKIENKVKRIRKKTEKIATFKSDSEIREAIKKMEKDKVVITKRKLWVMVPTRSWNEFKAAFRDLCDEYDAEHIWAN